MSESDELESFSREIESEITDLARSRDGSSAGDFRENAFTGILADDLEESGVLESPVVRHYESGVGAGSMKVNGYGIPDEDSRLDLFATLYIADGGTVPSINNADLDAGFAKLERYLKNALDGLHERMEKGHDNCRMAEEILGIKGQIDRVNLFLFTNARVAVRREKRRKAIVCGLPAGYEIWDIERFRRLRASGTSYEALDVDLTDQPMGGLAAVRLDTGMGGFRTWVTAVPGTLLCTLYGEYGSRLLELNVRSYLQAKGKVNKGIMATLKEHPEDFMAYNNGITVVAEEVMVNAAAEGVDRITGLRGMQIVNGGQTTASIHRAAKEFEADLSRVFVQAKVTVVEPARFQEVVPLISLYSNTQNKVSTSDLSANHSFHVGMERISKHEWSPDQKTQWFYERARGSYQTAKAREKMLSHARERQFELRYPVHQRFTKEDLARFENAWRGEPHWLSKGGQKNFIHFMERIGQLPDGWEPTPEEFRRYVAKGILFRDVQRIVRVHPRITAYQINVTAYTAALLAEKTARRIDLDRIWQEQGISEALHETAEAWAPVVFNELPLPAQKAGRHIDSSFKKEECWENIRGLDLEVPAALNRELGSMVGEDTSVSRGGRKKKGGPLSDGDHNNIARCMELNRDQWNAIVDWGQSSGELADWQRGIAHTLAGYAAERWAKTPTKNQAKHAVLMIEVARKAGALR